ncbi:hypothetical protein [Pseudoclavibacter sp. VKM Ac-2867]|uniref:hypothetical protein n=1 Tax=Pseudoclavibacter sp. VKM Ac-2867 TaxID=2783829 RepID=UPI00188CA1D4|nr:hypothetical protein [Pseudoclavibacter sp. VKM Ac-2867]MBF4459425.1 hypothetical protein [Pseudoclavibacter sp. VKM Ac-2867]
MTNQTDARREQARGNGVVQAGQFGHQAHSAPGAFDNSWWGQEEEEPADTIAATSIDVSVRRFGLPSSRHWKEQSYSTPGVLSVEVPIVERADVPAVATITDRHGKTRSLLIHDGNLIESTGKTLEEAVLADSRVRERSWGQDESDPPSIDKEHLEALQQDTADRWMVVDGLVHRPVEEPVLVAQSWGVQLESARYARAVDERGFITGDTVFTLDEWDQAKGAAEVSRRTYDDGSRTADEGIAFEAGEALAGFQTKYRRPPALDYDAWPHYDRWADRHEIHVRELARMRRGIASVPDAVSRVDDGLGGTRVVIDWSKFSEQQEQDYRRLVEYSGEG